MTATRHPARTAVRLEFKLDRFVLVAVAIGCLVLAAAALYQIWQLSNLPNPGVPASCLVEEPPDSCAAVFEAETLFQFTATSAEGLLSPIFAALPFVAGVLVGVGVVGGEIDGRTAVLAWTLAPSRRRWFLRRVAILVLMLGVLVAIPALAAVSLEGTEYPNRDALAGFHDYQSRGAVLIARAVLAFSVATLAGAWLGKVLPALIVAAVVSIGLYVIALQAFPYWMPQRELIQRGDECVNCSADAYLDSRYRLGDGTALASWSEVEARARYPNGTDEFDDWYTANVTLIPMGYPDGTGAEVSLSETAGTLVLAGVVLAAATVVVNRRRPY